MGRSLFPSNTRGYRFARETSEEAKMLVYGRFSDQSLVNPCVLAISATWDSEPLSGDGRQSDHNALLGAVTAVQVDETDEGCIVEFNSLLGGNFL